MTREEILKNGIFNLNVAMILFSIVGIVISVNNGNGQNLFILFPMFILSIGCIALFSEYVREVMLNQRRNS